MPQTHIQLDMQRRNEQTEILGKYIREEVTIGLSREL